MSKRAVQGEDDIPQQPKVLLVDDDEVNLLLTSIALRERGFTITEASGAGGRSARCSSTWRRSTTTPSIM